MFLTSLHNKHYNYSLNTFKITSFAHTSCKKQKNDFMVNWKTQSLKSSKDNIYKKKMLSSRYKYSSCFNFTV